MSARSPRTASVMRALSCATLIALASLLTSCSRSPLTAPTAVAPASTLRSATPAISSTTTDEIVLTLAPGADPAQVAADYGSEVVDYNEGYLVLRGNPDTPIDVQVSQLSSDSRVLTVEPNNTLMLAEARQRSFSFDDGHGTPDSYMQQPAADAIALYSAHYASHGDGVLVAVLDTGVDPTHPALAGRLDGGWDFVDHDRDPTDVRTGADTNGDGVPDGAWGHGTHVAGIVALVAPAARIMPVRVLDADGVGRVSDVAAGIRWAVDQGARVINLSLGMLRSSPAIRLALGKARAAGVVCVASAGNEGVSSPVEYPAGSPDVIAVAACDASAQPASWTSYGSFVGLTAPGVGVRSAFPGGEYRVWSGTSMSAAFVSGTAALVLANHPAWGMTDVLNRLAEYSRAPVGASAEMAGGLGAGVLNAGTALAVDLPPGDSYTSEGTPEQILR